MNPDPVSALRRAHVAAARSRLAASPPAPAKPARAEPPPWWDEDRRRCLEMVLRGAPKARIARELGVARDTIFEWVKHPEFARELLARQGDSVEAARIRRAAQKTRIADTHYKLLRESLKEAIESPSDILARSNARAWGAEFRLSCEAEREEFGDDVKKVQVQGAVHVQTSHTLTLRQILEMRVAEGGVDSLPDPDMGSQAIVAALVAGAASDPRVFDIVNEEDRLLEAASEKR